MASMHPVTKQPLGRPTRVLSAMVLRILGQTFDHNGHALGSEGSVTGHGGLPAGPRPGLRDIGHVAPSPLLADSQALLDEWDLENENSFIFDF